DGVAKPFKTSTGSTVFSQCKKRYCRCIDMRNQSRSKNDSIAGVPAALRTRSVAQHLRAQLNSVDGVATTTTWERLFERDQRKSGRNDPTGRVRKPGPSILIGIELDRAIDSSEFPFPEPVTFATFVIEKPSSRLLHRCGRRA